MTLEHRLASFLVTALAAPVIFAGHIVQTNLVSNLPGIAAQPPDANLVNSWGIVHGPKTPWWVADNGTGVTTLYTGNGTSVAQLPKVVLPSPSGPSVGSTPTGAVFNGTTDFMFQGKPSLFMFATEDGTIVVWSPADGMTGQIAKPANGGVYKGLAIGQQGSLNRLYVANFHDAIVEVYDTNFKPVSMPVAAFTDPMIPAGFAPFNVLNINGMLFVSFAMQKQPDRHDEADGPGLGYVDVFNGSGVLQMRLEHGKWMNAPWGMVQAPGNFGEWSNRLLIGQFGSGQIATFDSHGEFEGLLRGPKGKPININGLWGLGFGNDGAAGPSNTLFFAAGLNDEADGLFGTLTPSKPGHGDDQGDDGEDNGKNQGNNGQGSDDEGGGDRGENGDH